MLNANIQCHNVTYLGIGSSQQIDKLKVVMSNALRIGKTKQRNKNTEGRYYEYTVQKFELLCPRRLKYLNKLSSVEGALWGGLVGVALLEEYLTGVTFECTYPCATSNLHCGLFLWFKMLILSFLPLEPHLPLAIILTTCHQCSSPQRIYVQINQSLYKFLLRICYITAAEKLLMHT